MTRIEFSVLENQLVIRQRCLGSNLWNSGEAAVLDVGDLERELGAFVVIGHMAVLAGLVFASERAVEPLEVGSLLERGRDLIATRVVNRQDDRGARRARLCAIDLSSK